MKKNIIMIMALCASFQLTSPMFHTQVPEMVRYGLKAGGALTPFVASLWTTRWLAKKYAQPQMGVSARMIDMVTGFDNLSNIPLIGGFVSLFIWQQLFPANNRPEFIDFNKRKRN